MGNLSSGKGEEEKSDFVKNRGELIIVPNSYKNSDESVNTSSYTKDKYNRNSLEENESIKLKYKIVKKIGSGSFGKVFLIKSRVTNDLMALKIIDKTKIQDENSLTILRREKNILEKLDHPFIVKVHSTVETKHKITFIMDYYSGGDLLSHIVKRKRFDEETAKHFATQIYIALEYLHKNKIVYRDLKSENLILDIDGNIKLIDFGLAKEIVNLQNLKTRCGTGEYLGTPYTFSVDWWEYGIVLYEMLIGKTPFESEDKIETYKNILNKDPDFMYFNQKINISYDAQDLILKLLEKDPEKRIRPNMIPTHIWFKHINFEDVLSLKIRSTITPGMISKEDKLDNLQDYKNDKSDYQFIESVSKKD